MNKLKRVWSNIFGISAIEYAGFRLLVFTALFCWAGLALVNYFTKSPYDNYEKDAKLLDSLLLTIESENLSSIAIENEIVLEVFDPNTASKEKLIQVGFPEWLATRLINYRSSGAQFNKPKDVLKLYDFPDSLYAQIEDYIKITPRYVPKVAKENPQKTPQFKEFVKVEEKLPVFDLNEADTSVFQTIRGIGSKLSNRIVEYRNSLGGFISYDQLYQVYRLDSSVIDKIINTSLIVSDFNPLKINVNICEKEQLASHPYISWNQAKLIIAYRNQHGAFNSDQELLRVYSMNEEWIKKIAPYLTF